MTDDERFAALEQAIASIGATDPAQHDRPVPSCPEWTLGDLIDHVTRIHTWATRRLQAGPDEHVRFPREDLGRGTELQRAFGERAAALVATLRAVDLDQPAQTFIGPQPARWWLRRQAQETAVHAWDAQGALGEPEALAPELAVEGIDELLEVFLVHRFPTAAPAGSSTAGSTTAGSPAEEPAAAALAGSGATMHLHATDVAGEWLIRFDGSGPVVTREHAKGDVAARGTASDLLLYLWGRRDPGALDTFGDTGILTRYQAAASF